MTTLGIVLLVWAGVLAVLVAALALGTRRRRPVVEQVPERRGARIDRRRGDGNRRMGMPDLRPVRVERRTTGDRRGGMVDRRRTLGPV
jgi:hypothetical protein